MGKGMNKKEEKQFREHLDKCAEIVRGWPLAKRICLAQRLGTVPVYGPRKFHHPSGSYVFPVVGETLCPAAKKSIEEALNDGLASGEINKKEFKALWKRFELDDK